MRFACLPLAAAALSLMPLMAPAAGAADGWRPTGSLLTARAYHTATPLSNGKVLVAGGLTAVGTPTASAEVYDTPAGTWRALASMASPRFGHTASLLQVPACAGGSPPGWCGKVLVAGGSASGHAELYDPAGGGWSPAASLATPRAFHTATVLGDGRVLVAGGETTAPGSPTRLASAEVYEPGSDSWAPAASSLVQARRDHTATRLADGRVLVVGGRGSDLSPLGAAELFDPADVAWTPAGSLATARFDHTATLLADRRVLVAGGDTTFSGPRRSAELYLPNALGGGWTAAASMATGRARATATRLAGGAVMVAGGAGVTGHVASAELYHPAANGWMPTGPLAHPRERHTATALGPPGCGASCGRVLVAGGLGPGVTFLSSAELFGPLGPAYALPARPPGAVRDLAARALSARRVRLTFSAPSSGRGHAPVGEYLIKQARRSITASIFPRARTLCRGVCRFSPGRIGDRISLTVTGLAARRTYHYMLRPRAPGGALGPLSNAARARTRRDRIPPGRVSRLSAAAVSRSSVRLRFRAVASDRRTGPPVRRYVIRQSTRPITGARAFRRARRLCRGSCRFSPRRVGARLRLEVMKLCPGRRYHYAIRAIDEGGNLGPRSRFSPVRTGRGSRGRRCGG